MYSCHWHSLAEGLVKVPNMATAYSSSKLRERDKILEEKHRKELAAAELKFERLKRTNQEILNRLFDTHNRENRLAISLGFVDSLEAQAEIDNAERPMSYRDCMERVGTLESELKAERESNEQLVELLRQTEEQRDQSKASLDALVSDDNSKWLFSVLLRFDALTRKSQIFEARDTICSRVS